MIQYFDTLQTIYLVIIVFLLGACVGSGMNCLAYRIVTKKKWSGRSRSACPECGHTLSLFDLIPIFSWVFLGGKCRYCKKKISARYPITEVITGLCFVAVILKFDITVMSLTAAILVACLLALSVVDLDTFEIPDRFIIIPAIVRILYVGIKSAITDGFPGCLKALGSCILPGIIMGGGVLLLSLFMDKVLKRESMGGGDIKFLGMAGLWITLPQILLLLIFACIIGLVFAIAMKKGKGKEFPFGPAISAATFITIIFGETILNAYLSLFSF